LNVFAEGISLLTLVVLPCREGSERDNEDSDEPYDSDDDQTEVTVYAWEPSALFVKVSSRERKFRDISHLDGQTRTSS
jgi:hypothetical protein